MLRRCFHQIPAKKLPEDQHEAGERKSWVLAYLASVPPDLVSTT